MAETARYPTMIGTSDATALIAKHVAMLQPVQCPLQDAAGCLLAIDIIAPYDIPAYPQASMDGFALAHADLENEIRVTGEIAAGSDQRITVAAGQAVRIFTGAPLPDGADTIVVREYAKAVEGKLQIEPHAIKPGQHVRPVGSEISKGAIALKKNTRLTPAAIGFLAGMGISEVLVVPMPSVAIIVTGNELISPGKPLGYGQVYESNSASLIAALKSMGIHNHRVYMAGDDPEALTAHLKDALATHDMVLMTGGVSVGDYDFTMQAFRQAGVEVIFHKIRQKPGKPLLFGTTGDKAVFGLPGNPASVLTCFYMYVTEGLSRLTGLELQGKFVQGVLKSTYQKPADMTHFLKADIRDGMVTLLEGQESYKLHTFAIANGLAVLPEQTTQWTEGDTVNVYLLPA